MVTDSALVPSVSLKNTLIEIESSMVPVSADVSLNPVPEVIDVVIESSMVPVSADVSLNPVPEVIEVVMISSTVAESSVDEIKDTIAVIVSSMVPESNCDLDTKITEDKASLIEADSTVPDSVP